MNNPILLKDQIGLKEVKEVVISCLPENDISFLEAIREKFKIIVPYDKEVHDRWEPGCRLFDPSTKTLFFCLASDSGKNPKLWDELMFAIKTNWLCMIAIEADDVEEGYAWFDRDNFLRVTGMMSGEEEE